MNSCAVHGVSPIKAANHSQSDEVVLIGVDCPNDNVLSWKEELAGLAIVRSAKSFDDLLPAKDTLVVTIWSNGITIGDNSYAFPNLLGLMQPSTRVVGIYLDTDKTCALAVGAPHNFAELSWLRSISDMVVISSDSGVVVELVSTLAMAAR